MVNWLLLGALAFSYFLLRFFSITLETKKKFRGEEDIGRTRRQSLNRLENSCASQLLSFDTFFRPLFFFFFFFAPLRFNL